MGITVGFVITVFSVVGIIGCITALAVSGKVFKKQREKILKQIESE